MAKQVKSKAPSVIDEFGKSLVTYCDRFKSIKRIIKNIENFKSALKDRFETFGVNAFHFDYPANVVGYIIQEFQDFFGHTESGKYKEILSDNDETYVRITGKELLEIIKDVLISEEHSLRFHVGNIQSSKKYDDIKNLLDD